MLSFLIDVRPGTIKVKVMIHPLPSLSLCCLLLICMLDMTNIPAVAGVIDTEFGPTALHFVENNGQMDDEVKYFVKGKDKTVYFTTNGLFFSMKDSDSRPGERWTVKHAFLGACSRKAPEGRKKLLTRYSYFKQNAENNPVHANAYGELVYRNLWPGIDLVYSITGDSIKYEYRVEPSADPADIRLAYYGAESVEQDSSGALIISTPMGSFKDEGPVAYQKCDDHRKEIPLRFDPETDAGDDRFVYGFDVGEYDPGKTLILDPVIFLYCGFLVGDEDETVKGMAVDSEGCVYLIGTTNSTETSFPVTAGPDLTYNGDPLDTFVAKVSADGKEIVYCGFYGGDHYDFGTDIAVDEAGCAYICGWTSSSLTDASSSCKRSKHGFPKGKDRRYTYDAFVAKVNPAGTQLVYDRRFGGDDSEYVYGIALDDLGCTYVVGSTKSTETTFPVVVGPDLTFNSNIYTGDAFVAKLTPDGQAFEYCGYIGGIYGDRIKDIALDDQGCAYVVGSTGSDETTFPVKIGPDLTFNHISGSPIHSDAFIAKVAADGSQLEYCGYIGGTEDDYAQCIALDDLRCAYIGGDTTSDETTFPVRIGPDLTFNLGSVYWHTDGFVAKVAADGSQLEFCGYIGGTSIDEINAIDIDAQGMATVAGYTYSSEASFPVKGGPDFTHNSKTDAFIAQVTDSGEYLEFCGYIGGSWYDSANAIAIDDLGNIYVAGGTESKRDTFPDLYGPSIFTGPRENVFVAKLCKFKGLTADVYTLSESAGGTVEFQLDAGPDNGGRKYLLLGSASPILPVQPLPDGLTYLPLNLDFFSSIVFSLLNTTLFENFAASLAADGKALARLNSGPLPPGSAGTTISFAYCLGWPWEVASEPVNIEIVP